MDESAVNFYVPLFGASPIVTKYDTPARDFIRINRSRSGITFVDNPLTADIIVIFEAWSTKFRGYVSLLDQ